MVKFSLNKYLKKSCFSTTSQICEIIQHSTKFTMMHSYLIGEAFRYHFHTSQFKVVFWSFGVASYHAIWIDWAHMKRPTLFLLRLSASAYLFRRQQSFRLHCDSNSPDCQICVYKSICVYACVNVVHACNLHNKLNSG